MTTYHIQPIDLIAYLDELPPMAWTEDTVRDQLPDVDVRLPDGAITTGTLTGRANQFATLTVRVSGIDVRNEVAWPTLVHVLNTGSAVRI